MPNLEQIRAAAALPVAANLRRSAISKLPGLILNNGLLATAAFCGADKHPNLATAMEAVATHLAARGIVGNQVATIQAMIADLSARNSLDLQRATSEALAFLSYLKRFATND